MQPLQPQYPYLLHSVPGSPFPACLLCFLFLFRHHPYIVRHLMFVNIILYYSLFCVNTSDVHFFFSPFLTKKRTDSYLKSCLFCLFCLFAHSIFLLSFFRFRQMLLIDPDNPLPIVSQVHIHRTFGSHRIPFGIQQQHRRLQRSVMDIRIQSISRPK